MQGGPGTDWMILAAVAAGIPLGIRAVRARTTSTRAPAVAADTAPPGRQAQTIPRTPPGRRREANRVRAAVGHPGSWLTAVVGHPGTWLTAVVALFFVNQVLLTVYILRVHDGDVGFITRYLPSGWFHLADGPVMESLADGFPGPQFLAPTVLRVQSFLELPLVILLYLLVARWLDPGLYRRLGSGVLLWTGCLFLSGAFCWMEWLLPSPWTTGNLLIRACSTLLTPLLVSRMIARARSVPDDRVPGRPRDELRTWMSFLVSVGALGVVVLQLYDTVLLYNLGNVAADAPAALAALGVMGVARFLARSPTSGGPPASGRPGVPAVRTRWPQRRPAPPAVRPFHAVDTLVTGMTWFLGVFFVPAMPIRYGLGVLPSLLAIPATALLVVVAGAGTLHEVGRRVTREPAHGQGRRPVSGWVVTLVAAGVTTIVTSAAVSSWVTAYPETRILLVACTFLGTVTVVCALADRVGVRLCHDVHRPRPAGPAGSAVPVDDADHLAELLRDRRCLLLDFDGPVCRVFAGFPAPEVAGWMRVTLQAEGLPLTELDLTTADPMKVLSDAAASSPAGQVRAEQLLQEAEARCVQGARPTPGAHDLIRSAYELGMRVVVVSNNGATAIRAYLDLHHLADVVPDVIGRDPNDASLMKPHPHLMYRALAATGCEPGQAVFVGDSITDVAAGRSAGIPVIGFANKPHKFRTLAEAGADVLVTDMRRIADELTRRVAPDRPGASHARSGSRPRPR